LIFYIIRFSHKHGSDVWPRFTENAPSEDDIIDELKAADLWDGRDEYVEVYGPFQDPRQLEETKAAEGI
jgi:hypothetical protein